MASSTEIQDPSIPSQSGACYFFERLEKETRALIYEYVESATESTPWRKYLEVGEYEQQVAPEKKLTVIVLRKEWDSREKYMQRNAVDYAPKPFPVWSLRRLRVSKRYFVESALMYFAARTLYFDRLSDLCRTINCGQFMSWGITSITILWPQLSQNAPADLAATLNSCSKLTSVTVLVDIRDIERWQHRRVTGHDFSGMQGLAQFGAVRGLTEFSMICGGMGGDCIDCASGIFQVEAALQAQVYQARQ